MITRKILTLIVRISPIPRSISILASIDKFRSIELVLGKPTPKE